MAHQQRKDSVDDNQKNNTVVLFELQTDDGTALHEASLYGRVDVVRLLLERGLNKAITRLNPMKTKVPRVDINTCLF